MARDLSRVKERDGLKAQREPYWQRLRAGCFIGFRPSKKSGAGTWIARTYDEDLRKYRMKALGDFGTVAPNERFALAKKEAEAFADLVEAGGEVRREIETVKDACEDYLTEKPGKIAEGVFRRHVYNDPLAGVRLDKLRKHHLKAWRKRLEDSPAIVSRPKDGQVRTRKRSASTVNRDMAVLRAALGRLLAPGAPRSEAAWQEALRAVKDADGRRDLYLDRTQRRKLLDHIGDEAKPFVRALCFFPLRPGAMAALTVRDFDKRTSELTIAKDKNGKPRRIQIPPEAARLFRAQAKGKLPSAPLFMRSNGKPWDRNSWKLPISAAVKVAGLPAGTSAYTLRHSGITDLIRLGLPILTAAQISGTSVAMIEKHYGHLGEKSAVKALGGLTL